MPNVKKAKSWLCKQAPLGVKGAESFDWVNHDQIYSTVLEEWSSMRDSTVLYGDALCKCSDFFGWGLGFANS